MDNNIKSRVNPAAIGLMVIGILSLMFAAFSFLGSILDLGFMNLQDVYGNVDHRIAGYVGGSFAFIFNLIFVGIATIMVFGALKMQKLESYELSMAASILAIIPCLTPCCIGIPFGIWSLVVLLKPEVKQAFKDNQPNHHQQH